MNIPKFVDDRVKEIRRTVGRKRAICALSGGVDSSTTALLGHRAIGKQLSCFFIDDGLMRQGEPQRVKAVFKKVGVAVSIVDAKKDFFSALAGITDPEEKRKAFRHAFYSTLGRIVRESRARFMLQGTIKPDIIETKGGVKTQHNVLEQIGINPKKYGFEVIEPVKELFKPGVRKVAKYLGLPKEIYARMPFPGPGLATRVLGEVTPQRVETVRKATAIIEKELAKFKAFQTFAVLLNDRATGVEKGKRTFGDIIIIRAVNSNDAMKAEPTAIPFSLLRKIQARITREVPRVTRVLYDLTPKPPATIEYI